MSMPTARARSTDTVSTNWCARPARCRIAPSRSSSSIRASKRSPSPSAEAGSMGVSKKIAVVRGAPGPVVQALFSTLAERWQPQVRVVGAIAEDHGLPDRACSAGYLRSLADGARYPIFQDLGRGSEICHLAGDGAVMAAAAIARDI